MDEENDIVQASYVYILQSGANYKIGKANNIVKRVKELQTGNPVQLVIAALGECISEDNAFTIEAAMHNKFKELRGSGEWFSGNENVFNSIVEVLGSMCGTVHDRVNGVGRLNGKITYDVKDIHTKAGREWFDQGIYDMLMDPRPYLAELANYKFKLEGAINE